MPYAGPAAPVSLQTRVLVATSQTSIALSCVGTAMRCPSQDQATLPRMPLSRPSAAIGCRGSDGSSPLTVDILQDPPGLAAPVRCQSDILGKRLQLSRQRRGAIASRTSPDPG